MIAKQRLEPLVKWPGGKSQELKFIHPLIPKKINRYFEPFVGGGAVYFSLNTNNNMFINDKSQELVSLYKVVADEDPVFYKAIEDIIHNWALLEEIVYGNSLEFIEIYKRYSENEIDEAKLQNIIYLFIIRHNDKFNGMFDVDFNANIENFIKELKRNIYNKIRRMKNIEQKKGKLPSEDILDNIESSLKSAFYMHFRYLYNNHIKYSINSSFYTAIFFFIRNYAYGGMFRYNNSGGFNVPYGGIGYNRKSLAGKLDYFKSERLLKHLKNTKIDSLDFESFFKKYTPAKNDFIFLDPPYDTEFSTYAQNEFTSKDQARLANALINKTSANWMLVIKNTDFIYKLYNKKGVNITRFDKRYLVSFQNRNDKDAEHLIVTNYSV